MEVDERVKLLVSDILDIDPATMDALSGPENLEGWDSLAHLRIVAAVEEEFGVKFTMQEIGEMTSLREIARLLALHETA